MAGSFNCAGHYGGKYFRSSQNIVCDGRPYGHVDVVVVVVLFKLHLFSRYVDFDHELLCITL